MPNSKRELAVVALSAAESSPGHFALILEDVETRRRIPVVIGQAEAQSIAVCMERMQPARPLTHDLYKTTLEALGGTLKEVLIHSVKGGVFHAKLFIEKADKTLLELDARTSDAIAIALRMGAPIYAFENVVEEAGLMAEVFFGKNRKSLSEYTLPELEELLRRVLEKEDYESAVRIRDFIEKRKNADGD
ncbi:MAG: bifunctional nuclease family protein [Saprospiraceae bacterium]|nr:bifunctional nuclease family protein [Saprospiraceae bacterium]